MLRSGPWLLRWNYRKAVGNSVGDAGARSGVIGGSCYLCHLLRPTRAFATARSRTKGATLKSVAKMSASGAWLVPTYNGVDYLDKPAFLFQSCGAFTGALWQ